jgi:hypothetical protein
VTDQAQSYRNEGQLDWNVEPDRSRHQGNPGARDQSLEQQVQLKVPFLCVAAAKAAMRCHSDTKDGFSWVSGIPDNEHEKRTMAGP